MSLRFSYIHVATKDLGSKQESADMHSDLSFCLQRHKAGHGLYDLCPRKPVLGISDQDGSKPFCTTTDG